MMPINKNEETVNGTGSQYHPVAAWHLFYLPTQLAISMQLTKKKFNSIFFSKILWCQESFC